MAFKNAQQSRLYLGSLAFAGYTKSVSLQHQRMMLDVTTLLDTGHAFIPGQNGSNVSLEMFADTDTTAGGQHAILTAWQSANPQQLTYCPYGAAVGSEAWLTNLVQGSLNWDTAVADAVGCSVDGVADGPTGFGVVIEDGVTAVTADGNGTARDLTASSSNGGVAHLHVTAFSGLTSNDITIEDSANGTTGWATIVTFAQYTAIGSQRVAITGTVRQYLRVVDNVTGTGSTNRAVAFARL